MNRFSLPRQGDLPPELGALEIVESPIRGPDEEIEVQLRADSKVSAESLLAVAAGKRSRPTKNLFRGALR